MDYITHPDARHRYITTASGVNIGPPGIFTPEHVRLVDIRTALPKLCRYVGHVDRFYSVAEHSVLVSRIAELLDDDEAMIPALFHDAHEAYMADIPSPQKRMISGAKDFERDMERIVREGLALPPSFAPVWERVRKYDTMILHRELRMLRSTLPDWYDPEVERQVPERVQPLGFEWRDAEAIFRVRIRELGYGRPESA